MSTLATPHSPQLPDLRVQPADAARPAAQDHPRVPRHPRRRLPRGVHRRRLGRGAPAPRFAGALWRGMKPCADCREARSGRRARFQSLLEARVISLKPDRGGERRQARWRGGRAGGLSPGGRARAEGEGSRGVFEARGRRPGGFLLVPRKFSPIFVRVTAAAATGRRMRSSGAFGGRREARVRRCVS